MFLSKRSKFLFSSSARINYRNWAKTHEYLSTARPKHIYQDNLEYREYKRKVFHFFIFFEKN